MNQKARAMSIFECTKENPWDRTTPGNGVRVIHYGAHEVHGSQEDGWPAGDIVKMKCDFCGYEWTTELPQ